jgi:hypothetical protein
MPSISLSTKVLPRLETFFLEEWIEHYLMLGVSKVFICVHDSDSVNRPSFCKKDKVDDPRKWVKKPNADYFLDYTDTEVNEKLWSLEDLFPDQVFLNRHSFMSAEYKRASIGNCRYHVANNESDWWLRLDPDEFIWLSDAYENFQELIEAYPDYGCIQFEQRVFKSRRRDFTTRKISRWGYDSKLPKSLTATPIATYNEHVFTSHKGPTIHLPRPEGVLHHYRGHPKDSKVTNEKHHDMNCRFDKKDMKMRKYV